MKELNNKYYSALNPKERVTAAIEAVSREDDLEAQRLKDTCPKKHYSMTDLSFTHSMEVITALILALEADMRGCALDYLVFYRSGEEEMANEALQNMANLEAARISLFKELGVNKEAADKYGLKHYSIDALLGYAPEPNSQFNEILSELKDKIPVLK